ncbi:MAG: Na+/H+ antiporter subunit E [Parvibaculum sedimenti]|uniref:Na+/H+ antiporter subunit E n=1 Tax=Parvibaculum sedimenti TaxID=2608632 RepID=UPI003BB5F0C5
MHKAIALGAALFAFWLVLSGHYTPFLLAMGMFSVLLTLLIVQRMDAIAPEVTPSHLRPGLITYWCWLAVEIIKSSAAVTRVILSPRPAIAQKIIFVPTSQTSDMGRVIFANSITLTPGTVTVETQDGYFTVHALNEAAADLAALAAMDKRVSAVEARR